MNIGLIAHDSKKRNTDAEFLYCISWDFEQA